MTASDGKDRRPEDWAIVNSSPDATAGAAESSSVICISVCTPTLAGVGSCFPTVSSRAKLFSSGASEHVEHSPVKAASNRHCYQLQRPARKQLAEIIQQPCAEIDRVEHLANDAYGEVDQRNENERTALSTFFRIDNSRLPAVVLFLSWRRVPVRRTRIDARDGCFLGPFYFRNDILRNKPEYWPAVSQSKSRMVKRIRMGYFWVLTTSVFSSTLCFALICNKLARNCLSDSS